LLNQLEAESVEVVWLTGPVSVVVVVGTATIGGPEGIPPPEVGFDCAPAAAAIVIVRVAVPVPWLLFALIVTLVDPELIGVPVMAPVNVLSDRPPGNGVAL